MSKAFEEVDSQELTQDVKDWWNANPFSYLMSREEMTEDWAFFQIGRAHV